MPNIRRNGRAYEILSGKAGGLLKVVTALTLAMNGLPGLKRLIAKTTSTY